MVFSVRSYSITDLLKSKLSILAGNYTTYIKLLHILSDWLTTFNC